MITGLHGFGERRGWRRRSGDLAAAVVCIALARLELHLMAGAQLEAIHFDAPIDLPNRCPVDHLAHLGHCCSGSHRCLRSANLGHAVSVVLRLESRLGQYTTPPAHSVHSGVGPRSQVRRYTSPSVGETCTEKAPTNLPNTEASVT